MQYVSEAVAALCEAPLRLSDVPAAVAVCSLLHQRYTDFGAQMGPALAKVRVPCDTCLMLTVSYGVRCTTMLAFGPGWAVGGCLCLTRPSPCSLVSYGCHGHRACLEGPPARPGCGLRRAGCCRTAAARRMWVWRVY